jgi:Tellurite resistance protein TehB
MRLADPDKYKRLTAQGAVALSALFTMVLYSVLAFGQKPEYEFYFEFRTVFGEKVQEENHWSLTNEQVFEKYAAKLKSDGIAEPEIARRLKLLRTEHAALEADFYSRYYLDNNSNFNHAPNHFLMEMVKGRQPGVALDYGMGQGRNSIYLATIGWQVCTELTIDSGVCL